MSTVHVPRPFHRPVARPRRKVAVAEPGRWTLALGGLSALVGLPAGLVLLSLLLP